MRRAILSDASPRARLDTKSCVFANVKRFRALAHVFGFKIAYRDEIFTVDRVLRVRNDSSWVSETTV